MEQEDWMWDEYDDDDPAWSAADAELERWLAGEDLSEEFEDDGSTTLTKEEADELE